MSDPTDSTGRAVLTAVDGVGRDDDREGEVLGVSAFQQWCQERDAAMGPLARARMRWGTAGIHH